MVRYYFLPLLLLLMPFIEPVYAQEIISVNQTTPCFLNYSASYNILENCNQNGDYLAFVTVGWEWISGGYFTMFLVSVLIGSVYLKYKEAIYAIFIGLIYLPVAYFVFPDQFLSWGIVMAFVGVGVLIWYAIVRQTER